MASLRGFLERLSAPPEEIRAENLRLWRASIEGTIPIGEAKPRQRGRFAGVIQNIRIDPREGTGSIEATITDGTGQIVAKWLGRSSLSGIRLGAGLVIEGVCVGQQGDDELVMLNPDYSLRSGVEHA